MKKLKKVFTNKQLLQLLVTVVDAELLEAVGIEDLEAVNIEHADQRTLVSTRRHFNRFVNL